MSTQFNTGESPIDYWNDIAAGVAAYPSLATRQGWAAQRAKHTYQALENPPQISNDVAHITALSGDGTHVTATAINNFAVGDVVRFAGVNNDYAALNSKAFAVIATGLSGTQFEVTSTVGPLSLVITAVSADGTHVTFTSANTLVGGESLTFAGLGGEFAALNSPGHVVTSAGPTSFQIASAVGAPEALTITATSGSGTAVTFTAANSLAAGDHVTFAGLAAPYDVFNTGTYTVLSSGLSGLQFEVASAVTGSTTTGTGTGTAATTTGTATGSGVAATTGTASTNLGTPLPSVGLNVAATVPAIFDYSPQRYVL